MGIMTLDMNRCPACPHKDGCQARQRIMAALSGPLHDMNSDQAFLDAPADGVILVNCKYRQA